MDVNGIIKVGSFIRFYCDDMDENMSGCVLYIINDETAKRFYIACGSDFAYRGFHFAFEREIYEVDGIEVNNDRSEGW